MNNVVDFSSIQASLQASISLLDEFKNGTISPNVTNKELWEAKKIKQVSMNFAYHLSNVIIC